ncbi:spore coat polysaccharide biosynthesis protein SpsC [Nautilia profundicola AmH]|uniref:Spore coat polysaccharide biosynthesis protein SpsC n=1 Tax=Nautilia profundicola (strain ATCC BAA-1463 / DSM 18972 / AmH) TaxID=598659 RepID=B9L6K7_NAUPA|nr:DegT/DnrJ/EryC1/StrS family aminotransferase [Nautilia profundicola]ACM92630.1 spore coat polysaccharide biosynthesis protein SpsC [Nautilia profundicola AmH]
MENSEYGFIPYGKQYVDECDKKAVLEVLESDYLTTGPKVQEFEEALANRLGFKYVVVVSNGTTALHLASRVLLNVGDRAVTTPNSFLSTSNSILYVGAKPIFVDIENNGLINLDLVEEKLKKNKKIKAVYLVTFSGHPLDDEKVKYLKDKYGVKILYDNAHYFGKDGGVCDIATYSFHPVKHITTFEGGAVATNNEKIYKKLLRLRNHGIVKDSSMYPWEYKMVDLGYNYRLSDVACAMGLIQLEKVDMFLSKRRQIAKYYHDNLPEKIKPLYPYNEKSSYHLFVVRYPFKSFDEKAEFFIKMRQKGIGLQYHYIPINQQPFYVKKGYFKKFPQMEKYYLEAFSLPIYYSLSVKEQDYVIDCMEELL